jgi:hypothetical protein
VSHLSRDELVRWRDEGRPSERERVVGHLAECDACGAAYAELLWAAPAEPGPPRLDEAAFRARGYAAGQTRPLRFLARSRPALLAAAVAATAVTGAVLWRLGPPSAPSEAAIRGSAIQALAPVGAVSGPIEFRWASPIVAESYVVEVKDARGRVAATLLAEEERAADPSLDRRLLEGERYLWTVTALDADGEPLSRSAPQAFVRASAGR